MTERARFSSFRRHRSHAPSAKLSMEQARQARAEYAAGGVRQKDLAAKYGVSIKQMNNLLTGKTYKER